ncbi:hypothetical protein JGB54_23265, partial [Salmonella enterica subsp. enterica serovar Agona]|nr:hypothetical protein [Salmonella enterica subsp. enterica serovar Agona]
VQDVVDAPISARTISRRLSESGLKSCRPLRKLPLTQSHQSQRLQWCRNRTSWTTEWHRIVFSDESRFCFSSDSHRIRVWRRRGDRSNSAATVERQTARQRGIMIWGAIAMDSRSPLVRIRGTMTARRYVSDVLQPVALPYLQRLQNAVFQQDNPDRTQESSADKPCKVPDASLATDVSRSLTDQACVGRDWPSFPGSAPAAVGRRSVEDG